VVVGFDQTEVTVIEGEMVTINTSFKNIDKDYFLRIPSVFEVFTLRGIGNATG
jgi:FtsZ-interacting cell division protein YlmF